MEHESSTCGISQALATIGGKWTLLIVRDLLQGQRRFSELEESLNGISPRTLAARLKELEADEIVTRDCSSGHPIYALTERGRSLSAILDQMRQWGNAKTQKFAAK
jgi:DNA-binding HxlR family transcriptional regulator